MNNNNLFLDIKIRLFWSEYAFYIVKVSNNN